MNQVQVEYNYTNQNNVTTTYGPMALSDALCKYHTYDENTFIDSLGTVVNPHATGGNLMASAFNPYYGPYYDTASTPLTTQCRTLRAGRTRARRSRSRELLGASNG